MKFDINKYYSGHCINAYEYFGAHFEKHNGIEGVVFRLFAPNASNVELVGDFNDWQGEQHRMFKDKDGIYSLFVPGIKEYSLYKYRIRSNDGQINDKVDPYAFFSELRPNTASKTFRLEDYKWHDKDFIKNRTTNYDKPVSIYEIHLGSWKIKPDGSYNSYEELIPLLKDYLLSNGFTHLEFMPLFEYPFDGSWGYQAMCFFSMTSRYGNPRQLMHLIDELHQAGIGVIFDFVPVHFVRNQEGLTCFDGSFLYEYPQDECRNSQWGSYNFDLGKGEVRSFLTSCAGFLANVLHADGIRIDAVSNIIYWGGNPNRGINEGGINFIKSLNHLIAANFPGIMMIAEDSSDYPSVTKPTFEGGLGFDYKWDLGWMNDTLKYFQLDPIYRKFNHNKITFSMHYFYNERFLLPLSHDEVVHMKGSIVNKMDGNYRLKFASARALYLYQFTHPGKKLLFMGNELGEFDEWKEFKELNWHLLRFDQHRGIARLIRDLNLIYRHHQALHILDYNPENFRWIKVDEKEQSVFIYYRQHQRSRLIMILNLTPNYYSHFRFGVPWKAKYIEICNTDKQIYGGDNNYNGEIIQVDKEPIDGLPQSIGIRLAPLSGIILKTIEEEEEDV